MNVTYKKIAEIAHVSTATVSKALTESIEINDETAANIRRIAEELGYFEERRARVRRETNAPYPQLAIVVPEVTSFTYSIPATLLAEEVESLGGQAQIYVCGFDEARYRAMLDRLQRSHFLDGIFSFLPTGFEPLETSIPLIHHQRFITGRSTDEQSVKLAVLHLRSLGHSSIGFIGERNTPSKEQFFLEAVRAYGLDEENTPVFCSTKRFERIGIEGVNAFHFRKCMPTAIVAAYDEVALGAIQELRRLGYRVPEDVSVIGINNIPFGAFSVPSLTTVDIHDDELARRMIRVMQQLLQKENNTEPVRITPTLIVRESTAPPRAAIEPDEASDTKPETPLASE